MTRLGPGRSPVAWLPDVIMIERLELQGGEECVAGPVLYTVTLCSVLATILASQMHRSGIGFPQNVLACAQTLKCALFHRSTV